MEKQNIIRKSNSTIRKKLSDKIKKIKDKNELIKIFKIVNKDIGNNYSENKSGIYFNINLLSDNGIDEILNIIQSIENSDTQTDTCDDKIKYTSYSDNNIELYNSLGPRLSNQEKSILKKSKNIN